MNSSWKRRVSSAIFLAALIFAALIPVEPVEAAGCPAAPVSEAGGQHWCYSHDASKGNVHLWTPPGFKPESSITAVYIHGHHLNSDPCPIAHYIDCAWDRHRLASQFAASGVNALFVAVEAPTSNGPVKWGSLGSLLMSIKDKGNVVPSEKVTVLGHSYGVKTAKALVADRRVNHLVTLDWLHGSEDPPFYETFAAWYKADENRKLTIVSGSPTQTRYGLALANTLSCPPRTGTSSLSADEKMSRCLHINAGGGHMEVVTQGKTIPLAMSRSLAGTATGTAAPTTPTTPPSGGQSGVVIIPRGPVTYGGPTLEIPVPGIEFSNVINQNGEITIPWLAQYVGGAYTFLLSIAGLIASVMMVVGGFQYVTSGGDKGKVGEGKKKIVNALTGLVLALGSYTILYSINPDLVAFKGLTISTAPTEAIADDGGDDPGNTQDFSTEPPVVDNIGFANGSKAFCTRKKGDCPAWCKSLPTDPEQWPKTTPGYMDRARTILVPSYTYKGKVVLVNKGGKGGKSYAHPKVVEALKATVEKMTNDYPSRNLRIEVGECHRPLKSQIEKVCIPGQGVIPGVDYGSAVANPGGSNHGVGYACDLHLYDGTDSLGIRYGTKSQCHSRIEGLKLFDAIMFSSGWVRYDREVWHYEYGTPKSVANRCGGDRGACSYPPAHYCGSK